MTVIAYRAGIIAADRNAFVHNVIVTRRTKVGRSSDGTLVGTSGAGWQGDKLRQWVEDWGADTVERARPDFHHLNIGAVIIYPDRRILMMETEDNEDIREWYGASDFVALGAGAELAMGAMAQGATAIEAVVIASRFHAHCGGGVDWLDHQGNGGRIDG